MKNVISEEIIKIQPRGSLTIPKKLREDVGIRKNTLVRITTASLSHEISFIAKTFK